MIKTYKQMKIYNNYYEFNSRILDKWGKVDLYTSSKWNAPTQQMIYEIPLACIYNWCSTNINDRWTCHGSVNQGLFLRLDFGPTPTFHHSSYDFQTDIITFYFKNSNDVSNFNSRWGLKFKENNNALITFKLANGYV